jgi:hypothetical protein
MGGIKADGSRFHQRSQPSELRGLQQCLPSAARNGGHNGLNQTENPCVSVRPLSAYDKYVAGSFQPYPANNNSSFPSRINSVILAELMVSRTCPEFPQHLILSVLDSVNLED